MRILIANIPLPANRYLSDLNGALSRRCSLTHSSDQFWNMEGDYDVVHLHFPEYLTYEVESAYHYGLSAELIAEVETRLRHWSARSRILVTRHNLVPHLARNDPQWEAMYETVYRYADGVSHMTAVSVEDFRLRYAETEFNREIEPQHQIIPIQNYLSLPNEIGRVEARQILGLPRDAKVVLVFGAIRSDDERALIQNAFNGLRVTNKVLLVSQWRERLPNVSWIRLKYWLRDLTRLYHRIHPQHRYGYQFVPDEMTQVYLNASDVFFIPRIGALNSANVSLGFTFGKVVVGPSDGNAGAILRKSGNPVYEPSDSATATAALKLGLREADDGALGESNRRIARDEWDVDLCAQRYVDFYEKLLSQETAVAVTAQAAE